MEEAVQFKCDQKNLYGILHLPDGVADVSSVVLMVVGGPQTRIGSHRLYVQLARWLAHNDIAVFRFDYVGIGDSDGEWVGYKFAGPSIKAALDYLSEKLPALETRILWSLCDGATSSAVFAAENRHYISSMILCNPYLHSSQGQAKTILKYYYIRRVFEKEFWQKLLSFRFDFRESATSFFELFQKARTDNGTATDEYEIEISPEKFIKAVAEFEKPIRMLLSSDDLTAMQFYDTYKDRPELKASSQSAGISIRFVKGADHTFSSCEAKQLLFQETLAAIGEHQEHISELAEKLSVCRS